MNEKPDSTTRRFEAHGSRGEMRRKEKGRKGGGGKFRLRHLHKFLRDIPVECVPGGSPIAAIACQSGGGGMMSKHRELEGIQICYWLFGSNVYHLLVANTEECENFTIYTRDYSSDSARSASACNLRVFSTAIYSGREHLENRVIRPLSCTSRLGTVVDVFSSRRVMVFHVALLTILH